MSETPACPRCQAPTLPMSVRTTIWQGLKVAIVEDIPAHVCEGCGEQFYDEPVSDALRRLAEAGFPPQQAKTQITVPVFSLDGRIRERKAIPEDVYVD